LSTVINTARFLLRSPIFNGIAPARELPPSSDEVFLHVRHVLEEDETSLGSSTFREQCAHGCVALTLQQTPQFPFRVIARVLGIDNGTFKKRGNDVGDGERSVIMSEERLNSLDELITTSHRAGHPPSFTEIRSMINSIRLPRSIF
jgi:hypothetical protein